ncbi:MAG: hypothetical protein R8J85_07805 [Mariprofundales bacterium]
MRNKRWRCAIIAILVLLGGCLQDDQTVPDDLLNHLTGNWQTQGANSTITFYDDLSVKLSLTLPDQHLPARLLSTVEMMKDGALAISLGDRWRGPARVTMTSTTTNTFTLHLPGDNKDEEILFHFIKQ